MEIRVTDRLRRVAFLIWSTIGALVLLGVLFWIAAKIRIIWLPLAFAGGLVLLLSPLVRTLERLRMPRLVGVFLAFAALAGALVAAGFVIVPAIRSQAAGFGEQIPNLYDKTASWIQDAAGRIGITVGPAWRWDTVQQWLRDPTNQQTIQDLIGGFGSGAGRVLRGVAEVVAVAVLAPVLAFYMLIDEPRFRRRAIELTPAPIRAEVLHVGGAATRALGAFVRGQLLVAVIVGVLSSIGLYLIDMPFWLIIGLAAGLLNLVPFIGPVVGAILALIVGLVDGDVTKALLAVAIFTAIQQLDNHIITPLVQRARVHLSPVVIVLALVIGGSLAGLLGVLVAVPITAVVRIVVGHLWRTRVLGESWREAEEKMIEVTAPPEHLRPRRRRSTDQERLFDTAEIGGVRGGLVDLPREEDQVAGPAEEPIGGDPLRGG